MADFLESKSRYESLYRQWRLSDPQSPEGKLLLEQMRAASLQVFYPWVLVSRCPYCEEPVRQLACVFGLGELVWYQSYGDGRSLEDYIEGCDHLFCLDGALNLNGHQPTEVGEPGPEHFTSRITMAAEVPFVKPRVLKKPTMVAVIHSLPVAERYTVYWVAYFAQQMPPLREFCVPFARIGHTNVEYAYPDNYRTDSTRSDVQEYDLTSWIEQGKIFWIDPNDETNPIVRGSAADFPYHNIPGRRHPYYIENGQVYDLPNPKQGKRKTIRYR